MSEQITGKAKIKINGTVLATEDKATLNPGGIKRTPVSHSGNTYYSEENVPPELDCKVLLTKDVDVLALNEIKDATVLFEADTGQNYFIKSAFTTDVVDHNSDGVADLKMSGNKAEKV